MHQIQREEVTGHVNYKNEMVKDLGIAITPNILHSARFLFFPDV